MTEQPETFYCDKCLNPVSPIGQPDDIGTQQYQCTNPTCKTQTTTPRTKKQRDQSEELRKKIAEDCKPENIKKWHEEAKARAAQRIKDLEEEKQLSQADKLLIYFNESGAEIFIDQYSEPFVRLKLDCDTCGIYAVLPSLSVEHEPKIIEGGVDSDAENTQISQVPQERYLNYPLDSTFVKNWLANLMYEQDGKVPANESLSSAKNVLKGKAQKEGKRYTLYNRVAPDPNADGSIWLDMADEYWRAIHITVKGWEIVNKPPILFRRFPHQLPLIEPLKDGDAWELIKLTNIDAADEQTKLSFMCAVISYFIPLIAHPGIIVSGPQGSAKSWLLSLIKRLIDPSSIELLSIPESPRDLARLLYHHWIAPFDNITWFKKWVSDIFCKAITGMGIADRKLYTDDEEIIRSFKHCIMLNGINVAAQESDLLDRCLLIVLKEINKKDRKTEKELNESIQKALPSILGGCLNVLVKALELYPTIQIKEHQRLADFNVYGCAIALALGKTQEEFLAAYSDKVKKQNEEALNADDVALAFLEFCNKEVKGNVIGEGLKQKIDHWEGTPTELLLRVGYHADVLGIDRDAKAWPKSTNIFTRRLNQIIPALKSIGITITSYEGTPRRIEVNAEKYGSPTKKSKNIMPTCAETCLNYQRPSCDARDFEAITPDTIRPCNCSGYSPKSEVA